MKKFNLSEALEGKVVVTRDGTKVEQLILFNAENDKEFVLYGVLNGNIDSWTKDGKIGGEGNRASKWDLYMAEDGKSIWINVWQSLQDGSLSASIHSRKDKAEKEVDDKLSHKLIKEIEVNA